MSDNIDLTQEQEQELELEIPTGMEMQYFIPLDLDNLANVTLDKKLFNNGVKDYSYLAGGITALVQAGVSAQDALSYFINKDTIAHNIKSQEMVNDNNIKVAKIQDTKIQQQVL